MVGCVVVFRYYARSPYIDMDKCLNYRKHYDFFRTFFLDNNYTLSYN